MKQRPCTDLNAALDSVDSQINYLQQITNSAGITLAAHAFKQLNKYARQIIIWNQKISLIARRDIFRIARRHLYESLLLTKAFDLSGPKRVLDLGAGAGLPGIPLKIWNSELELTQLESQRKKVIFLELVSEMLGFERFRPICMRAEKNVLDPSLLHYFDIVIARAVAPLHKLLELAEPLLKNTPQKGVCLFPKGSGAHNEITNVDRVKWHFSTKDLSHFLPNNRQSLITVTAVLSTSYKF